MRTRGQCCCNTVIIGAIVAAASCALCAAKEPLMQATRDWHTGQIVVTEGEQPVLQYNYLTQQPPEGFVASVTKGNRRYARARSNYIHPLYGPHGEVLTHDWSKDHPHHRGIYWAWPEVDWRGERADLHALQRVFARPTGNITLRNGDTSARIEAENRWIWEDETPIVREVATICVHQSGDHGRYIDLSYRFEALEDDVALARRGTKFYGGLNIRLSPIKDMQLIHYADPVEAVPCRAWSDSVGIRAGGTESVGWAVFEKTSNPDYPGDWIEYPYLPWFQPTFPAQGTRYVLKKGTPLVLQYRLWIRAGGKATDAEYAKHWQIFNPMQKSMEEQSQ